MGGKVQERFFERKNIFSTGIIIIFATTYNVPSAII
jgi:hypothetical protein